MALTRASVGTLGAARDVTFTASGLGGKITNVAVTFTLNPAHPWVGDLRRRAHRARPAFQTIFSRTG